MKLPRRVPWASLAEVDEVCGWIFSDEADMDAKLLAVNRLAAWKVITPLPHALEATHSLLASILLDRRACNGGEDQGSQSVPLPLLTTFLTVRQSYAAAIIRFVNGLVDPLQLSTYARPIASIAAQIGLPQRLVELRHAATHEELPSLDVLRDSARMSLGWLLHNYFLPILSAQNNVDERASHPNLSPLAPLLKQYKLLLKTTTRDASLQTQYKSDITRVLRDIERWVGEAKVAAASSASLGKWAEDEGSPREESEQWALERLCECLIDRGGIVPVSSRKRLGSGPKSSPTLPPSLVSIWSPLLRALQSHHPLFPTVLVSTIVNSLLYKPDIDASESIIDETSQRKDPSYDLCLAAWADWYMDKWVTSEQETPSTGIRDPEPLRISRVLINLVTALGQGNDNTNASGTADDRRGARHLLDLIVRREPALAETVRSLLSVSPSGNILGSSWADNDERIMEERLALLLSSTSVATDERRESIDRSMDVDVGSASNSSQQAPYETGNLPRGWSLVPPSTWNPCPIGVYVER